jgi:hypothetical protein
MQKKKHADDTTLWTKDVGGAQVLIQQAVQPYCAASGAQVNLPKSWGMTLGSHEQLQGPHEFFFHLGSQGGRQHTPGGIACAQKWAAFHTRGG